MAIGTHPNRDELRAYLIGDLPQESFDAVGTHLALCSECETTVANLEGDTNVLANDPLIAHLRSPQPPAEFSNESELGRGLQFVRQIGREVSVPAVAPEVEVATPVTLGRLREYELLAKLGEGGMGAVYKARHTKLDKIVALKVLPADRMRSKEAVARFEREMRAVGKLDHPNLIRAHDAGEVEGTHFLVMEYVAGCDLSDLVGRSGPLSVANACELIRQTAAGLQYAHEHGLVHRDIKPSNLMLASDGQVKVLDLGLALLADEQAGSELTNSGQMMGTVDYMSPEQALSSHTVTAQADLYSLGASLYKLLTGDAPFAGEAYGSTLKKLMAIANDVPTPVAKRRNDVPAELSKLIDRMLAKKAEDRPASAAEVVKALAPFTAGASLQGLGTNSSEAKPIASTGTVTTFSVKTVPPAISPAQPMQLPNRPTWKIGLAIGLVGILVCGVVIIIRDKFGKEIARVTTDGPVTVEVRPDEAGKLPTEPVPPPSNVSKPTVKPLRRPFTVQPGQQDEQLALSASALVSQPAPIAGVKRWSIETTTVRGETFYVKFSPDAKLLATAGDDGVIRLWDSDTGELLRMLIGHAGSIPDYGLNENGEALSWAPDGRHVVSCSADQTIRIWDAQTGQLIRTIPHGKPMWAAT